jgi:AcrR family transcriptional regulator
LVSQRILSARGVRRDSERTQLRILDAAERLFSRHGLDGVSMRDIALAADAPLALANYHFGSKDGLYRAVFRRRIEPISAERRARLARVVRRAGPPPIADVLDALARPWVELRARPGGVAYARLVAREAGDPAEGRRGIVREMLDPIAREFIAAMIRALPGVPRARIHWAYNFFIGALLLILANPARVRRLSGGRCRVDDDDAVVREIVTFFSFALETAAQSRHRPQAGAKPKGPVA